MSDGMGRELAYLSSHATNRYFIPNWGNSLVNLVDEISMPFWTKEEARVMAIENFRENAPRPIDW